MEGVVLAGTNVVCVVVRMARVGTKARRAARTGLWWKEVREEPAYKVIMNWQVIKV